MAGNSAFQMVAERGWRRGLRNLMHAGFAGWWRTRTWWIHALVWSAVFNGLLAAILWSGQEANLPEGATLYCVFTGLFATVAMIIIMQGAVVGEKQTGTAAWVLSKPVSRTAFLLSKLVPNVVGGVTTMILIPGAFAYLQISLAGGVWLSPLRFLAGAGVLALNMTFYIALTVMLGALFNTRGAVIGIALGFAFGQQYLLGMLPSLRALLPWTLVVPLDERAGAIAPAIMTGAAPHSLGPVWAALACIALFTAIGVWRFERSEF